jgi:hypothetical protein
MNRVDGSSSMISMAATLADDEIDGDGEDDSGERDVASSSSMYHHRLGAGPLVTVMPVAGSSAPGGALGSRGPPEADPAMIRTRLSSAFPAVAPLLSFLPLAGSRRARRARPAPGRAHRRMTVAGLLIAALASAGCAKTATVAASRKEPFKLEKIEGTERKRVRLEPKAAERLGLLTATVTQLPPSGDGPARTALPYGALLYDTKGGTSVYTSPETLLFVRQPVTVESVDGDVAVLSEGPPPGTVVVTAGGSELTGIEFGVGK